MNYKITLSKYYVDQLVHQFNFYILFKNTRDMPYIQLTSQQVICLDHAKKNSKDIIQSKRKMRLIT